MRLLKLTVVALAFLWLGRAAVAQKPPLSTGKAIGVEADAPPGAIAPLDAAAPVGNAALFVGVNSFTEDGSLNSLHFAVNDAVAQAHLFVLELKLIPPGNCYLSLGGDPSGDECAGQLKELQQAGAHRIGALKAGILRTLASLSAAADGPADLLLVSISSHGFEDNGVPYAMPADGVRGSLADTAINVASIKERLKTSKAGKRLLLVDACREKAVVAGKGESPSMSRAFKDALAAAQGQAVLASCDAGQTSYENEKLGHGVFTYYLVQALRGQAPADNRGYITLGSVGQYVADGVGKWIATNEVGADANNAQTPWFKGPENAGAIPLAIDPGIRKARAAFVVDVGKVIDGLKAKIELDGAFDAALFSRTARLLQKLDPADAKDRELLENCRDFAEGRTRSAVFVAYVGQLREPAAAMPVDAATPKPSKVGDVVTNSIGMKFAYIPAGEFDMGSPATEAGHQADETQHHVKLTKPFMMGVSHVTKAQFAAFVADSGYKTDAEKDGWAYAWTGKSWGKVDGASWRNPGFDQGDSHPVLEVSWNDAGAFCEWLSNKEGKHYRLPTEAEYEYACRAGTQAAYPWGDNPDDGKGWANCADLTAKEKFPDRTTFNWADGFVFTSPVGSFKPNGFGLYDMIGNAWEWCNDWYADYPPGDAIDPQGPSQGSSRVLRGGSWYCFPPGCRAAFRYGLAPGIRYGSFGFRLCLDF